mgnify:CR=1 FL=1
MRTPRAFGLWTLGEKVEPANKEIIMVGKLAKIDGKAVYCPICKRRLRMWIEGCSLWHIYCKKDFFHFILRSSFLIRKKEKRETFNKLVDIMYE